MSFTAGTDEARNGSNIGRCACRLGSWEPVVE